MKNWMTPAIESLGVENTAQGVKMSVNFDEVRVDQNGKHWYSYASGTVSHETDKPIIVPTENN